MKKIMMAATAAMVLTSAAMAENMCTPIEDKYVSPFGQEVITKTTLFDKLNQKNTISREELVGYLVSVAEYGGYNYAIINYNENASAQAAQCNVIMPKVISTRLGMYQSSGTISSTKVTQSDVATENSRVVISADMQQQLAMKIYSYLSGCDVDGKADGFRLEVNNRNVVLRAFFADKFGYHAALSGDFCKDGLFDGNRMQADVAIRLAVYLIKTQSRAASDLIQAFSRGGDAVSYFMMDSKGVKALFEEVNKISPRNPVEGNSGKHCLKLPNGEERCFILRN